MKTFLSSIWILSLAVLVIGCSGGTSDQKSPSETQGDGKGANQTVANPDPAAESKQNQPKVESTDSIPSELKTAGYAYFGLGNAKSQSFSQTGGSMGEQEAGQQTTYLGQQNGEYTFKTVRTGAAAAIGDSELILRKDGLYTSSVGGVKLEKPSLEVPADLAVGKSWKSDSSFKIKVDGADQVVSQNMSFKAVAIEKVKTKLGDFDAMKIVGSGTMKVGSRSGKNESSMWFVKDIGLVRMQSKLTTDGVDQKMSMEIQKQQ